MNNHTQAWADVLNERVRQLTEEGFTAEHDDKNNSCGQLADAAICYAQCLSKKTPLIWPWWNDWWRPSVSRRRNLVKAAALLIAEIERLDRAEAENV